MKKVFAFILSLCSFQVYSQLVVNILVPPGGMVDKQQLWNILLTNTGTTTINMRIQLVLTEQTTAQSVLTASTGIISVPVGTKQLSASAIGPVQYNGTSGNYRIDPGPTGLLPVGIFNACYEFSVSNGKALVQDCQQLNIQPLSPLLLNVPTNGAVLEELHPAFNWLPLSPGQSINNLSYTLKLVEIYPGQSAADAIEKNIPLHAARNLSATNLFYAQNAPALEKDKLYAWQVTASNNLTEITKSETWEFTIANKTDVVLLKPNPVYVKLKKEGEDGSYCIFFGNLRFEYLNETSDTSWKAQLTDIGVQSPKTIHIKTLDTLKMIRGENLVDIPGKSIVGLEDKHIYLLQLINSRKERWQLKFEYRKEE